MATTRIIPMHLNKGKTLAQCLADRTEYGMNPDKTEGGALISAFACEPETAVSEFALSKREYRELTGRVQESDVIAYQVRQSFKPGEVTPEEANRIGYEFAKRFLKGRHAFLVCTHTDKKHIHNHIYWNSTAHNFQIHFRTLRPLQTAHDIFRAHLHTGNNRIIHHYNAVTGQNANLLRRTSRYRLYNEKSIFRHIKLNTDSFKIALQRLIHFFYLFRIRINRMRVKLFQHLYNGFFHHLAFIHLVDIQIGNGKLRQLQFTGRGIH